MMNVKEDWEEVNKHSPPSRMESSRRSLASKTSSTQFEVLGLDLKGQVFALGLEVLENALKQTKQ